MKQIALLEYTFLFTNQSPWQNISAFERDLTYFFATKGVQVEKVDVIGDPNQKVMYLEKAPPTAPQINKQPMTFKKPTGVK